MNNGVRSLLDVFPGAFRDESAQLAAQIQVLKVEICKSEGCMEVEIRAPHPLEIEERGLLIACIDIYLNGKVQVRLTESKMAANIERLSVQEKKRLVLEKLKEIQPSCAALLNRMPFQFENGLTVTIRSYAARLLKARGTREKLEEIVRYLGIGGPVQIVENDSVIEEAPVLDPNGKQALSQPVGAQMQAVQGGNMAAAAQPQTPDLPWEDGPMASPQSGVGGDLEGGGSFGGPAPGMIISDVSDDDIPVDTGDDAFFAAYAQEAEAVAARDRAEAMGSSTAGAIGWGGEPADSFDGADEEEDAGKPKKKKNQVMCGKPINPKDEITLARCDEERRQCTTRGIISSINCREIQNGKGILTIRITDYVTSLDVKAFVVMKTYKSKMEDQMVKGETILVKGSLQMDSYVQDLVLMANHITLCAEPLQINEEKKKELEGMLLGRPFQGEAVTIKSVLTGNYDGPAILQGDILAAEGKEIRGGRTLMTIDITDYTDAISVKAFFETDDLEGKGGMMKKGKQIMVKGRVQFDDKFSHEYQITADAIMPIKASFKPERKDTYEEKRVELHAHTKISEMDAVVSPTDLVMQASKWGHPAVAITDHGVVQGFPEAMDAAKKAGIKVIYGLEAYLVDDLKTAVQNDHGQSFDDRFVVFDIETTGFNKKEDKILEIGAVMVEKGQIIDRFSHFIDPERPIPERITELTSITDEDVKGQGTIEQVLPEFLKWTGDSVLVAHNAAFDTGFIQNKNAELGNEPLENTVLDTLELARGLFELRRYTLDSVAKHLGVSLENHHRAVDDAEATAEIFIKCLDLLREQHMEKLSEVNQYIHDNTDVKRLRSNHAVILVRNKTGLRNLYELVSLSHLNYFYRQPRIPKSEFIRLREGLLIGSACEAGELYRAVLENDGMEVIERLVNFYDYLEIQPLGNNGFMIADPDTPNVQSEEDLQEINKRIVQLALEYDKPIVATCDVHFKEPEDAQFRRILMASKGFKDADNQAPLYFRTTNEMMEEFAYLGPELCRKVVIDDPVRISEMVEKVLPIPDGQFSPVIDEAEEELKNAVYSKAHRMYGDPLPEIVEARIDRELKCIIKNGFATLYVLARRLVTHSVADGYYVGSRGSVGSSLVATMADITEINPLQAHYYCKNCQYSDFDSPEVKAKAGMSGFDLPDKKCPKCGTPLTKDGQEIPFEVFLGFDGDKEPDIDLNFSGEYQPRAHAYVEEMFGTGHVFRAGTMGGLAEKTAYGMVKKYLEERGQKASNAQINYMISGCLDVKRTTGQHPGGQIIVPWGYEVYDFCPVQHPANDTTTPIITTHFDYNQLHGRLLKLDILGHDDPTMVRMLEDITQTKATEVPIDDKGVMSLFHNTEALGVTPEQINSPVGTYGISEFGTRFVRQMLVDTKPQNFSDLVRISGLSHGTNVWANNAQNIVDQGIAPISECICTREDIMIDLIALGMDKLQSFKIMETVRKGKQLSDKDIDDMVAHGIEPWYLESCKKIQYLFPKGHAAAYVTMSLRIAYYKVYYKEAYYAAFYTIRADGFDYETMARGEEKAREAIAAIDNKPREEQTAKDKEIHTLLELVIESYCRGVEFLPIDLYKSHHHKFQIIDGKLLPPFDTLNGMGATAAESIVEAREQGEFLTIEDFLSRTKVSRTMADTMKELGIMGDLPETDQMSLF